MVTPVTIASAVDRVFDAFSAFVWDATFIRREVDSFNFSTGAPTASTASASAQVIRLREVFDDGVPYQEFVVRSSVVSNSAYDYFLVGLDQYAIEDQEIFEGIAILKTRRSNNG